MSTLYLRYILALYAEGLSYGVVASDNVTTRLIATAQELRSEHREDGTEWGDWYEVIDLPTGKTVYSSRLALEIVRPVMCPLCPECDGPYPIGDDFFGDACVFNGVRCCYTCYCERLAWQPGMAGYYGGRVQERTSTMIEALPDKAAAFVNMILADVKAGKHTLASLRALRERETLIKRTYDSAYLVGIDAAISILSNPPAGYDVLLLGLRPGYIVKKQDSAGLWHTLRNGDYSPRVHDTEEQAVLAAIEHAREVVQEKG